MLARFVERRGGLYAPLLGAKFASMTTSPRTGRFSAQRRFDYRRLISVFDAFVDTGWVDLSVRKRGGGGPQPTSEAFTALNAAWEADMVDRGLAPATRDAYGRVARGYLTFLESRRVCSLDTADGASVLAFVESLSPRWATTSLFWVVSNFRPFLTFARRADLVDAVNLAGVRRSHTILPVLGDDDERLVLQACASGLIDARDAAITLLVLTTGLRACDIIGLRLADVDWVGDEQARRLRSCRQAGFGRRSRVPAYGGAAHSIGRSRLDIPGDCGNVPQGWGRRCEGRDPPSTA